MNVHPLIDPRDVFSNGMGDLVEERPASTRTYDAMKACVIAVYPPGHPRNHLGQTVVDVQPTIGLPILRQVAICTPHAHEETGKAVASSARRQPYDPKPRNRMEGVARDLRPGDLVWLQFLGGDLREAVVVAAMRFNRQDRAKFPETRPAVDQLDDDGKVAAVETAPLDGDMRSYPRSVEVYNGVRTERTNTGDLYEHTSTDREPVFPGHGGIPASPRPTGNAVRSTRGARHGDLGFVSGRHPRFPDDESRGRQFRRTIDADDGTIRDETLRAKLGDLIRRARSESGRIFDSTRGSKDGRVYQEDRVRNYLALSPDGGRAELHGETEVVLDGDTVYLGSGSAASEIMLWPQFKDILDILLQLYDAHTHTGVTVGEDVTGPPEAPILTQLWDATADLCKASGVKADQENSPNPTYQDEPGE